MQGRCGSRQKREGAEVRPDAPPAVRLRFGDQALGAGTGGVHGHVSPCTGKVDAIVPLAGRKKVGQAVGVAQRAFEQWRRARPAVRRPRSFGWRD